jgi:hypothetical protein
MQDSFQILQAEAASLFAATIVFVVFFLVARVAHVRQLVALAFAMMPLLLAWAAVGLATAGV